MRLSVICRADQSGIAAQSLAVVKNLGAERVLVVDLAERGRGPTALSEDDYPRWVLDTHAGEWRHWVPTHPYGQPRDQDLCRWLCDGGRTVYCVETTYPLVELTAVAADLGSRVWVHANPELYDRRYASGPTTRVALPTPWMANQTPHDVVLPMPVDRGEFPFRRRTRGGTFMALGSPAMLDRNGAGLVRQALPSVGHAVRVLTRGLYPVETNHELPPRTEEIGRCLVEHLAPVVDHRVVIPDLVDVLLIPRRYGGLSLPMAEAASLGVPVVSLRVAPQDAWLPEDLTVPAREEYLEPMKGGAFPVYTADPAAIAAVVDRLAAPGSATVGRMSVAMDDHARSISWESLRPTWEEVLAS